jgi:hypothetical protein
MKWNASFIAIFMMCAVCGCDEHQGCPDPPVCQPPLVSGGSNGFDENGCALGYCCTGIDVTFESVIVTSTSDGSMTVLGKAHVSNIGSPPAYTSDLSCEVRSPSTDALLCTCTPSLIASHLEINPSQDADFELDCYGTAGQACGETVAVNFTYDWDTIGCYSHGESSKVIDAQLSCQD